ncbi:DUF4105 domain-containing protein [Paludibacter sp. 221]|uniref:Lnb N-terminal periplasmic domain-containing protein n=1 Tax=Paludibacter sp. 221 TaxID=2302939 RepID=UPI0013D646A6|nr:DUF4105 domain-containing protein [Paludibacter sp. 221]NDV45608.1 DUF4105 domain-containing protein [Paludibacter sp. 221]
MKRVILFFLLLISVLSLHSQPLPFSDNAVVSLITCSPGKEVYARFGHTAIRINDPATNNDVVFNYGIFDFNTKNFYLKFIKGETDYKLGAYDFDSFLPEYENRNSAVWEQVLNLNQSEKEKLIRLLLINYEPENRIYRYNFVFDNCSTRPRDKIIEAIDGYLAYKLPEPDETFRELIDKYISDDAWLKLGIDIIFGDEADRKATRRESMFLPEILMSEFQGADICPIQGSRERHPLVSQYNILVDKKPEENKSLSFLFQPFSVFTFLLLLCVLFCFKNRRYHRTLKVFDTVLFSLAGLVGCVIFFLSFISVHPLVSSNFNILWLNPLLIFAAVMQWFKTLRFATFCLQLLNSVLLLIALILLIPSFHYVNISYLPIILLLLVRTLNYLIVRLKRGIKVGKTKIKYSFKRH